MGREYRHSIKESLTRRLVLIIVVSVVCLYACIINVQTFSAKAQSGDTTVYLKELRMTSFQGMLLSRSG